MADNLNTPSLPEIKPLSRRHVMAGGAAVLSAMTGAAMAGKAVAGNPDSELLAACREWWKGYNAERVLWVAVGDAEIEDDTAAGVLALQAAKDAANIQEQRLLAICAMRPRTVEGLYAKAKVLRTDDLVFPMNRPDEAWTIFADIEALAMEGHHNG